jgi:uncharacterized protein YndB with AHSA1/START domain
MTRVVRIERRYPHPPGTVWSWLSSSDAMAQWLMPNTFEPRVGHRFEFHAKPAPGFDGVVRCEVLEVNPPKRLAFTWVGGGLDTTVRFDLVPDSDGTILRLEHSGFTGAKGVLLSYMLGNGWTGMLSRKLPRLLVRGDWPGPSGPGDSGGEEKTLFWRIFDRVFSR